MQNEEKLVFVRSDMLLNEKQFDALRERVETLTDYEIRNFMYFHYSDNEKVSIASFMACTDEPDWSPHPTEIIKSIRKNDYILMNFKTLKQFLSL